MSSKLLVSSNQGTLGSDPELWGAIRNASNFKNIPRYLFRVWSARSGGDSSLNTTFSVTPHAFAPNYNTGHNSIFEMETKWFIKNLIGHFCARPIPSEFSSWTASPVFALRVAYNAAEQRKERNVHIAIVDTERLKNTVLSVPLTWPIFRSRAPEHVEFVRSIHFEYLIHGVVQGEAYKAVSLTALDSCGLSDYFSALKTKTAATRCIRELLLLKLPEPAMTLSGPEAETLFKIATLYGESFCAAFFVALYDRSVRAGGVIAFADIDLIIKDLLDFDEHVDRLRTRDLVLLRGNVYLLCTVIPVVFLVLAILREFEEALHIRLAKEISDPAARAKDIQNVETIKNGDTANTLPHEKHTRSTTRKRVRDSGKKNKSVCSAITANHEHLDTDERQAISLSL
ncbi:unnamed protein product [Aureobasidium pullulans]|nr:unnamed protein product [Aureobasidium pullulans]